MAEKADLNWKL